MIRFRFCRTAILMLLLLWFSSAALAAAPTFQAAGAMSAGTGARTVAWPAHAVDDVALLIVQTANQVSTLSTPAGFVEVLNSPQGTGTAGGAVATRLTVFWARATSTGMTSPVVADSGNNQVTQIITFRGVIGTGNPWDVTAGDVAASASTSFTIPGATTAVSNALVVAIVANGFDTATSQTSGWTNASLSGLAEVTDVNSAAGNGGGFGVATGVKATAGAYNATTGTLANSSVQGRMSIALKPKTTTIADGTNPANSAIAPGAAITDLDAFTLATSNGTDSITALTVTLTGANSFQSLSEVRITDSTGATTYFSAVANPASNTVSFSGGTPIPVTTTATTFKVRITPKTHANMPVPPGLSYAVGGTVTAFTSTNEQAGTDSASATVTVDNLSPAGATATSGSAGNAQVTLNWTTSASTDFSRSVMLRWTGGTAGTEVPAEGTDYANGNTISTATVVCVRTADAASTAVSGVDGAGTGGCSATALTNGQTYTYKIFQKDSNGNYDTGVSIGSFTPVVAVSTFDACEATSPQCAAGGARLFTKLVGTGFNMDLIALDSGGSIAASFTGTASSIDLIAYTAANPANMTGAVNRCPVNAPSATINLGTSVAFTSGRKTLAVSAFSSAYRDVRVRITYSGTNYCSSDKFSVRPQALTIGVTDSLGGAFPATLAAGANFRLTASGGTGYDGTPASLTSSAAAQTVRTHVGATDYTGQLLQSGANTIAFPAAVSGVSNAMVQYHDVGSFEVLAQKVIDSSFTSADLAGSDCVSGSASNTDNDSNSNNGLLYGCNIANTAASGLFGRFYPSYYTLASSTLAGACGSSPNDFTYMGQSGLSAGYTLSAWSQANPTSLKLTKYTTGYSNLATVSVIAANGTDVTDISSNLTPALTTTWSAGDYTVAVAARTYARPTAAASGPYDSLNIAVGITDSDGAALSALDFKSGDPSCTVSCTHKKLGSASTKVRFGRLRLSNAYGSELLDLPIPIETQYWNSTAFVTNSADNCTTIQSSNIALVKTPVGCTTAVSGNVSFNSGLGNLKLSKPGAKCTAGITVNLAAELPSKAYLQGKWSGVNYDQNPTARATFGVYKGNNEFIYLRENY